MADLVDIHRLSKSISAKLQITFAAEPSAVIVSEHVDACSDTEDLVIKVESPPTPQAISTPIQLRLLICSWNVGNSKPPKLLDDWIPQGGDDFDVVVIGVQESYFSKKKKIPKKFSQTKSKLMRRGTNEERDNKQREKSKIREEYRSRRDARECANEKFHRQKLVRQLQAQLGPLYNTVALMHLWQMRMIVFVREHLRSQVTRVEVAKEATGVGHVVGNKGGLFATITIGSTSLCFVSCHLAAHEAVKFQKRRNADCAEIIRGCSHPHLAKNIQNMPNMPKNLPNIPKKRSLMKRGTSGETKKVIPELTDHYNHAFWFGDLNYRIDLDPKSHDDNSGEAKRSHKDHFRQVQELIDARNWPALQAADGLNSELAQHRVLSGWTAAAPNFAPTFKLHRGLSGQYKDHRIPSYCDRVLWRSMPALAGMLECTSFHSVPSITTSDHTPIAAAFTIRCAPPVPLSDAIPLPVLIFTELSASSTRAKDLNGKSDPFVSFFCDPPGIAVGAAIGDRTTPRTCVCHGTLNPVWAATDIPRMRLRVSGRDALRFAHVVLCVVDHDFVAHDDFMGQATLSLAECCGATDGEVVGFERPIILNGQPAGIIRGRVQIVFPRETAQ